MPEQAAITPDTKVGDLLERWPELEQVLVELSPHFKALRNPVLRRTIAKVANLRQAASVGNVPLHVMIERLRAGAGLSPLSPALSPAERGRGSGVPVERPRWAVQGAVTRSRDARADIEAGEHPLAAVMADLAALSGADVYELVTPFVPAPLLDRAREKGFACYSVREGDAVVRTFFRRDASGTGRAPPSPPPCGGEGRGEGVP